MKLNQTYSLREVLASLDKASESLPSVVEAMKASGELRRDFITYSGENMTTSSPYARITLTSKVSDYRWEGYMETSAWSDGPRTPVAVIRSDMTAVSENSQYSNICLVTRKTGACWANFIKEA